MKHFFFLAALLSSTFIFSQGKTPRETITIDSASVTYGRPTKTGADIFGNMQKYGKIWMVGAGKATTITFTKNIKFAGEDLAAGTYSLFAIPGEDHWTIILNSEVNQWEALKYDKHKEKNVLQADVPVTIPESPIEQLTIRFPQSDSMIIEWDKAQVTIPIVW